MAGEGSGKPRRRRRSRKKAPRASDAPAPARESGAPDGASKAPRRRRGRGRSRGRGTEAAAGSPRDQARQVARRRFGVTRLHAEQEQAIESVLAGRDTLAVLPTGFGKSLIYQVPAMLLDGPTVVISPLIALMQDQERSLLARDIPVVRLDSTLRVRERRAALARIAEGGALVVLTTPETLESEAAREAIEPSRPQLLCVDEAHCISEWGHDFRPAYLRLGTERKALGIPRVLALTATATPRVQRDIAGRLRMKDHRTIVAPPHRKNLRLSARIVPGSLKIERAGHVLRRLQRPGIVYCATKRAVDEIYGALVRARIACGRYHGGMKTADRVAEQETFMKRGRRSVMVATSAFGMGIDKPDIRYIMHYQVPASPEQYVQEAGRAGRDGRRSDCILLFDPADLAIQEFLQDKSRPSAAQLKRVGWALAEWARQEQPMEVKALALSAGVPMTTARSLCAQLEEGGLVTKEGSLGYLSVVEPEELKAGALDLAKRFEIERRQDAGRLRAMTEYAETEECRSVFLRKWFGEEDPPACGNCDQCRERCAERGPDRRRAAGTTAAKKKVSRRGGRRRKSRRRRSG